MEGCFRVCLQMAHQLGHLQRCLATADLRLSGHLAEDPATGCSVPGVRERVIRCELEILNSFRINSLDKTVTTISY